jgi:hypothetical protein
MKNLALILMAVVGTSVAAYAQDGTKKQEPKKKTEIKKKVTSENKKITPPVKKN